MLLIVINIWMLPNRKLSKQAVNCMYEKCIITCHELGKKRKKDQRAHSLVCDNSVTPLIYANSCNAVAAGRSEQIARNNHNGFV